MNQQELITQCLRLRRKLSAADEAWHSGRIDRLADALRTVERELDAARPEARAAFADSKGLWRGVPG